MKDKEYNKHHARLQKRVPYWIGLISSLVPWRIHCVYYDSSTDMPSGRPLGEFNKIVAQVYANWQYLEATIHWNIETVATLDNDELDRAITHELSHIIVNEMREEHVHHEERVCTELGNSIFNMERAGKMATQQFVNRSKKIAAKLSANVSFKHCRPKKSE